MRRRITLRASDVLEKLTANSIRTHDDLSLYGSAAKGDETPRSDIDVCIVAPQCRDRCGLSGEVYRNLDVFSKKYDVRIFEELPLHIQTRIIQSHVIIHTKDIYELYEYFYYFRKLWMDQAPRQEITGDELARMLG